MEYQGLFFSYAASYPYAYSLLAAASEIKKLLTTFWNSETRSAYADDAAEIREQAVSLKKRRTQIH